MEQESFNTLVVYGFHLRICKRYVQRKKLKESSHTSCKLVVKVVKKRHRVNGKEKRVQDTADRVYTHTVNR